MTDFKAKCIKLDFGWGSVPDPPGGAYSAPPGPRPPSWISGHFAAGGGAGLGKGEVEGREREGPKLMLNQGPSEPCYATAKNSHFWRFQCATRCDMALIQKLNSRRFAAAVAAYCAVEKQRRWKTWYYSNFATQTGWCTVPSHTVNFVLLNLSKDSFSAM